MCGRPDPRGRLFPIENRTFPRQSAKVRLAAAPLGLAAAEFVFVFVGFSQAKVQLGFEFAVEILQRFQRNAHEGTRLNLTIITFRSHYSHGDQRVLVGIFQNRILAGLNSKEVAFAQHPRR